MLVMLVTTADAVLFDGARRGLEANLTPTGVVPTSH
jgi:hypothetical protein